MEIDFLPPAKGEFYGVIYQLRKETLLIVAVMHLSREPETWKSRLKKKEL